MAQIGRFASQFRPILGYLVSESPSSFADGINCVPSARLSRHGSRVPFLAEHIECEDPRIEHEQAEWVWCQQRVPSPQSARTHTPRLCDALNQVPSGAVTGQAEEVLLIRLNGIAEAGAPTIEDHAVYSSGPKDVQCLGRQLAIVEPASYHWRYRKALAGKHGKTLRFGPANKTKGDTGTCVANARIPPHHVCDV